MPDDPNVQPEAGGSDLPLSQEDIDAAMAAAGGQTPDTEPQAPQEPERPGDVGEISQDDIDALLAASGLGGDDPLATSDDTSESGSEDPGTQPGEAAATADTRLDSAGRPFDEAAAAMAAALAEESQANASSAGNQPAPSSVDLPAFGDDDQATQSGHDIDLLQDVNLQVKIELGRTRMLVEDVLKLGEGSVVELDKLAGDPVDVYANDRLIARGEVLVLNDNFCVRVSDIIADQLAEEPA